MNKRFANRLNMFTTVGTLLAEPSSKTVYLNNAPVAFTALAVAFTGKVEALTSKCAAQQASTLGYTVDKKREEAELEAICFEVGNATAALLNSKNDSQRAAQITRSRSGWEALPDADLLLQAETLCGMVETAIALYPEDAPDYGVTVPRCQAVQKELDDYRAYVQNPAVAVAGRKAITDSLREEFGAVNQVLGSMDKLVVSFNGSDAGRAFVNTYFNARQVIDRGMPAAVAV